MCDEEVMSLIAEKLGSDLIVIPSSIHETIILKRNREYERKRTECDGRGSNAEAVDPQERLGEFLFTDLIGRPKDWKKQ